MKERTGILYYHISYSLTEVPQASTGYSPFELLYGHSVRGPMEILSDMWQSSEKSSESVISHIRQKLEDMRGFANINLKKAQQNQKVWYDQNARLRDFAPNDQVLLLLPTTTNKLMASWQGPYRVVRKVGKVN